MGRVDPASGLNGDIFVDDDGEVYDVMLNLVDVARNHDKYFILQVPIHPQAARTTRPCTVTSPTIAIANSSDLLDPLLVVMQRCHL